MNEIRIQESQEDIIRTLIDVQEAHGIELKKQSEILDALQMAFMTNLRFELHDAMYNCILKGFATPDEYDLITSKMEVYNALKGNHGIQELYNNQFKQLPIKQ